MKKVLIICGGLQFGGVERFAANIIRYAPQDEFAFDYLVFEGLGYAFAPEIESKGGRVITFPSPQRGHIQYIRNLLKLMKQNQRKERRCPFESLTHIQRLTNIGPLQ